MRLRVPVALAVVLWFSLVAAFVVFSGLLKPARADRLYPVIRVSRVYESERHPRDWATLACPVSFGRFAPSAAVGLSPRTYADDALRFDSRVELTLTYRL